MRRGRRSRVSRLDLTQHVCPRCKEKGDPRSCACMRTLARRLREVRHELNMGRPTHAGGQLREAERMTELLALDAQHQARDNRPPKRRRGKRDTDRVPNHG